MINTKRKTRKHHKSNKISISLLNHSIIFTIQIKKYWGISPYNVKNLPKLIIRTISLSFQINFYLQFFER